MRPEPHRDHCGRRDRAARDLGGGLVVPEDRAAVLDRRAGRPDVAALDVELAFELVALLADPRLDVGRQVGTIGHALSPRWPVGTASGLCPPYATTPALCSCAISSGATPAAASSASVSVRDPSGTRIVPAARGMPASGGATWRK